MKKIIMGWPKFAVILPCRHENIKLHLLLIYCLQPHTAHFEKLHFYAHLLLPLFLPLSSSLSLSLHSCACINIDITLQASTTTTTTTTKNQRLLHRHFHQKCFSATACKPREMKLNFDGRGCSTFLIQGC